MSFTEQLEKAVSAWESGNVDDEWIFQKLRENSVRRLSPSEAFEEIPRVLAKVQGHAEESVATELIETVLALAKQSQTTERPCGLEESVFQLQEQFGRYGTYAKDKLQEMLRFYRI